ncbi:hypothetical protein CYMTET_3109 [Cymbomonas tetramitiformis]|uniref:Uncharacterized protein n=1 Tax=Cymbomonas tetramitiformis TaxID=36881 RepID=A0AAE0H3Z2_9CHLO|nr:hypothetical protein CYMTET_3109 [Cymbomonas tetramitiformis]
MSTGRGACTGCAERARCERCACCEMCTGHGTCAGLWEVQRSHLLRRLWGGHWRWDVHRRRDAHRRVEAVPAMRGAPALECEPGCTGDGEPTVLWAPAARFEPVTGDALALGSAASAAFALGCALAGSGVCFLLRDGHPPGAVHWLWDGLPLGVVHLLWDVHLLGTVDCLRDAPAGSGALVVGWAPLGGVHSLWGEHLLGSTAFAVGCALAGGCAAAESGALVVGGVGRSLWGGRSLVVAALVVGYGHPLAAVRLLSDVPTSGAGHLL